MAIVVLYIDNDQCDPLHFESAHGLELFLA
jgi:hypothetical protein